MSFIRYLHSEPAKKHRVDPKCSILKWWFRREQIGLMVEQEGAELSAVRRMNKSHRTRLADESSQENKEHAAQVHAETVRVQVNTILNPTSSLATASTPAPQLKNLAETRARVYRSWLRGCVTSVPVNWQQEGNRNVTPLKYRQGKQQK